MTGREKMGQADRVLLQPVGTAHPTVKGQGGRVGCAHQPRQGKRFDLLNLQYNKNILVKSLNHIHEITIGEIQ